MMSEDFEYFSSEYGPMDATRTVSEDFLARMATRLPATLLEFISQKGLGSWQKGRFQFCDPDDFSDIIAMVFDGDAEIRAKDCEVFGYTAFGILLVWSRTHQNMIVKLARGEVEAQQLISGKKIREDIAVTSNLLSIDSDAFDQFDKDGKVLFKRAVKKLGPLDLGECFGFVPALSFGGSPTLDNVKKQPALAHFGFLAQATSFQLMDYGKRPAYVRDIG